MSKPGQKPPDDEVPTLPLPSRWRLIVAAAAILGFLAFIYQYESRREAERAGEAPPAAVAPAPSR